DSIRISEAGRAAPTIRAWPPEISGPSLHVTADKLIVHEAPLPGMRSGRLMTDDLSTDLTIGGSLKKPIVRGKVGVDLADFRMPDTLAAPSGSFVFPFAPVLDVEFDAGPKVRISSAQ